MSYITILLSLAAGMFAGVVFSIVDLPIPAPPNLAGIMGIVGIYIGYQLIQVTA